MFAKSFHMQDFLFITREMTAKTHLLLKYSRKELYRIFYVNIKGKAYLDSQFKVFSFYSPTLIDVCKKVRTIKII